jgi:hypothetical protein
MNINTRFLRKSLRSFNAMNIQIVSDRGVGYIDPADAKRRHRALYRRLRREWLKGNRLGVEYRRFNLGIYFV